MELICSSLVNLQKLHFDSNSFNASSMRNIRNLASLKILDVRNNLLGD